MTSTVRLVALVPLEEAARSRFRRWQSERCSGKTVTMSTPFEDVPAAMAAGHRLPPTYVWHVENASV